MSFNIDECIETLKTGNPIPERALRMVCEKVKNMLIEESNV